MLRRFKGLSLSLFVAAMFTYVPSSAMDMEALEGKGPKRLGALKVQQAPQHLVAVKDDILQEQYSLIEGADLALWGIGLFAGTDIVSKFIRKATGSEWSHVGLILKDQKDQLYCFESTGSASDILKKGMLPQVQIHKWEDVVSAYSGGVAYRQITFINKQEDESRKLTQMVKDLIGTPYERDLSTLINCIERKNTKESPSSLFCSEMAADIMMDLGYLSKERVSSNYMPKDFSSKEYIPLQGIKLETEIMVKHLRKSQGCCILI